MFSKSIDRVAAAFKIVRDNPSFMMAHMAQKIRMEDMFAHNGIFLHFTMMLTYIKSQGTKEQQAFWLEKAQQGDFIAAYAQTELGHGSNVRGLETTATYDPSTQEYEIHSPTLTSLKWWPTGMYACTHALVFAQLLIGGKDYGMHGFMLQLRGADGVVMPGVELGEIGPKLNDKSTNIG
jgi:acyl-CoA oxidase